MVSDIYKHISLTLKALRKERGWSLDKAAEVTGVSKAMLGQIERQESSPTITTLWKIASGFDTSFSSFIEDVHIESNKPIYRAGQAQQIHPTDKKIRVMPLFPFDDKLKFEIYVVELLPYCQHLSPPHQPGVIEHVVAIDGNLEVLVDGVWQTIYKGEGLRFNANQAHGYKNPSPKLVTFHNIIHY